VLNIIELPEFLPPLALPCSRQIKAPTNPAGYDLSVDVYYLTKVAVVDRYHRNEFVYKNEGVGAIVK
jgi:hypothetical protein